MIENKPFQDKVIWITGASSGYGEAVAKAFAEAGAKLVLSARREDKLQPLAKALGNADFLPLDLSRFDTFSDKVKDAIAAFGAIDIMVHAGAIAQNAAAMETTLAVERYIMDVDYFSYTELTRQILPHMLERKSGQIVVVSGLLAQLPAPRRATYAAAKAALIAYFDSLRIELLENTIDITLLIPGAMQTSLVATAIKADGQPDTTKPEFISPNGITVNEAAKQTLGFVAQKRKQAYVGLEDDAYHLWQLSRKDPEAAFNRLLNMMKSAAK